MPLEENLVPGIPLQNYSSLLGRAPTRFSLPQRIKWRGRGTGQGMIPEALGGLDAGARLPPVVSTRFPYPLGLADENGDVELSAKMRADLLDFDTWGEVLRMYARTMRVAVALTDSEGMLLGKCHNPQAVWNRVRDAASDWGAGCPSASQSVRLALQLRMRYEQARS